MEIQELKVGMEFESSEHNFVLNIIEVTNSSVTYGIIGSAYTSTLPHSHFIEGLKDNNWHIKSKPLDKAFKELDKQLCSHKNIREDRFFSAMVYKTCKDCGKPLN